MRLLFMLLYNKKIYPSVLLLLIVIVITGCSNKTDCSEEELTEFFLGIPADCSYSGAEDYVAKLYADSLIRGFKMINVGSETNDSISFISKSDILPNTIHALKMVGIDSVTGSFSIWSNLILEDGGEFVSHPVRTDLFFFKDVLLAVEITPIAFSHIKMESLLDVYRGKYGEPEYFNKKTETSFEKLNIKGIKDSFLDHETYVSWEEDFYTIETIWSFKNAFIKLVDFHHTDVRVYVSEYSYNKAEEFLGKRYGSWDEQYLKSFLSQCTIIKKNRVKSDNSAVFYINRETLDAANKEVKKYNDNIQRIRIQNQKEEKVRDSISNSEKRKKYLEQQI